MFSGCFLSSAELNEARGCTALLSFSSFSYFSSFTLFEAIFIPGPFLLVSGVSAAG